MVTWGDSKQVTNVHIGIDDDVEKGSVEGPWSVCRQSDLQY